MSFDPLSLEWGFRTRPWSGAPAGTSPGQLFKTTKQGQDRGEGPTVLRVPRVLVAGRQKATMPGRNPPGQRMPFSLPPRTAKAVPRQPGVA